MKPFPVRRDVKLTLTFLCVAMLFPSLSTADELTDDEREKDPTIQEQTDKTGSYVIEVEAVPLKLFYQYAHREGRGRRETNQRA